MITEYPELVQAREALVASSQELQERDRMKMASLSAKIADALADRGVLPREAQFVAQAGASIFMTAIADWTADPTLGFEGAMHNALSGFRAAVGA